MLFIGSKGFMGKTLTEKLKNREYKVLRIILSYIDYVNKVVWGK